MNPALLEVTDLRVWYGSREVSHLPVLALHPGECIALVGESGSGKTSALLAILGLVTGSGATVSGSVRIEGHEVVGADERTLSGLHGSAVTLVSQSPQSALNPTMRLGRLIRLALKQHHVTRSDAKERIASALRSVVLPDTILSRYPHEISGGQAQRFCLALAVSLGVRCIVADEPTSALDVTVQAEILGLLDRLRREQGIALLLVSHDLALVSTIADRIVVMRDGTVVEAGDRDALLNQPQTDYAKELLAAVPTLGEPL